jgi:hypothetical protein
VNEQRVARFLGLFSIGVGVAEVAAARALSRFLGTGEKTSLVRGYGLREIASGIGIFLQPRPAAGVWSRVGGDVADLASLGAAWKGSSRRRNVAIALAAIAGVTLLDLLCARKLSTDVSKAPGRYPQRERRGAPIQAGTMPAQTLA